MKIGDLVRVHPRLFVNPKAYNESDIGIITEVRGEILVRVYWVVEGKSFRYNKNELEVIQAKQ